MLYKAAFGRSLTQKKKLEMQKLPQEEVNSLVLLWAKKAGWKTQKKKGTDKNIYLSFHP
ncbi:MAG: hypothetical protein Q7T54_04335 [Candidatus Levybacteria bacterium]|nr:hypothetical protein [Candidatus Levybacteria bacterium]